MDIIMWLLMSVCRTSVCEMRLWAECLHTVGSSTSPHRPVMGKALLLHFCSEIKMKFLNIRNIFVLQLNCTVILYLIHGTVTLGQPRPTCLSRDIRSPPIDRAVMEAVNVILITQWWEQERYVLHINLKRTAVGGSDDVTVWHALS
jgi:hypothetical protein